MSRETAKVKVSRQEAELMQFDAGVQVGINSENIPLDKEYSSGIRFPSQILGVDVRRPNKSENEASRLTLIHLSQHEGAHPPLTGLPRVWVEPTSLGFSTMPFLNSWRLILASLEVVLGWYSGVSFHKQNPS